MPEKPRLNPYLLLLIGTLSVSTAAILIRLAQRSAGSLAIAAWRLVFASLLAWAIVLIGKKTVRLPKAQGVLPWLLLAGFSLAVHFASWISSLEYTSIASSTVMVNTIPLWVALLSPLILKEPIAKAFYIGLAIAFLGGLVLTMGSSCGLTEEGFSCNLQGVMAGKNPQLGMALALLGAATGALYYVIGRKTGSGMDTVVYTAIVYSISAFFLLSFAIASGEKLSGFSPITWLFLIGMAVIPQTLGHSVLNHALKFLPAMLVSVAMLGEPVGSTILAVILLKESPALMELIGGALILIGILYAVWPRPSPNAA